MSNPQVEILKRGLKILEKEAEAHKKKLGATQVSKGSLSEEDEQWLDTTGNFVDEVYVIDFLKNVPDYKKSLEKLEEKHKDTVLRLQEAARDVKWPTTKKHNHKC